MAYWTKAKVAAKIADFESAISEVLVSQELDQGGERGSLRRAELKVLEEGLARYVAIYDRLDGGGIAVNHGIPRRN
jgi:hypothetical protein